MKLSISVIIPAYNDADTIGNVINNLDNLLPTLTSNYEILVINDQSRDNTLDVLRSLAKKIPKLKIKTHKVNKGHGQTLKELYYLASKEIIFSLPGNGQIAAKEILKLIPHIYDSDMIIGQRKVRNVQLKRKVQSRVYNALINLIYGLDLKDVNSVRILKRSCLKKIYLQSKTSFIDAELCYKFGKNGFRIIEVPINHTPGQSRGGGSFKSIMSTFTEAIISRFGIN